MASLVAFLPEHLSALALQPAQEGTADVMDEAYALGLAAGGPAWTLFGRDGRPLACGGLYGVWTGRAIAWALLSPLAPMVAVTRAARVMLGGSGVRRVECFVDVDFPQGHRWATMLGFRPEGVMRAFCPRGRDHTLYARID